jgi:nucleoside-diphosphate-sugar epimerase
MRAIEPKYIGKGTGCGLFDDGESRRDLEDMQLTVLYMWSKRFGIEDLRWYSRQPTEVRILRQPILLSRVLVKSLRGVSYSISAGVKFV